MDADPARVAVSQCKTCKRELVLVLDVWRDAQWLTFCGVGDQKHAVEVVPACSHCQATDHDWLGCVKLWTSPEMDYGSEPITVTPDNPDEADKAKVVEQVLNFAKTQRVRLKRQP